VWMSRVRQERLWDRATGRPCEWQTRQTRGGRDCHCEPAGSWSNLAKLRLLWSLCSTRLPRCSRQPRCSSQWHAP